MNFLQIVSVFFSEKKQTELLNHTDSTTCVYNLNFIRKYKRYNKIHDSVSAEDLFNAYELFFIALCSTFILSVTYSFFISFFNIESYIVLMLLFLTTLCISFCSAKIYLFKKHHEKIEKEYLAYIQRKWLKDVVEKNKTKDIPENPVRNRI